jgi:hypothetical protein
MPKEFHTTSSKKYTCKNEEDPIPYKIKSVQYFAQRVVNWSALLNTELAVGERPSSGLPKKILCEIRQEESRKTNKQTRKAGKGGRRRVFDWIVLTNEMGSLRELFRLWGDV